MHWWLELPVNKSGRLPSLGTLLALSNHQDATCHCQGSRDIAALSPSCSLKPHASQTRQSLGFYLTFWNNLTMSGSSSPNLQVCDMASLAVRTGWIFWTALWCGAKSIYSLQIRVSSNQVSLRDEVASPSNNLKHFPPPQRCPLTTYSEDQYSATEAATVQVRSIPLSWFLTAQTWPRWSSALPLQSHPTVLFSSQPSCPV